MLFLLSPAKKLDYDTPLQHTEHTQPLFVDRAASLIKTLNTKSAEDIAALMSLSPALASLNAERYAEWKPRFTEADSRQAVLAFNGDVYGGLDAPSLSPAQLKWAQEHLAILSGLYGVLRPLDLMRPYRLEMGTRLETARGKNLYDFWGEDIADYLNERLAGSRSPVVVNLASDEYFKAVSEKALKARVVKCVFQDWKSGTYKVINFYAKRARGLMARYAIQHKIGSPEKLQDFDSEGYAYDAEVSTPDKLVFRRRVEGA